MNRHSTYRTLAGGAAVLALALAATGCGSSGSPAAKGSSGDSPSTAPAVAAACTLLTPQIAAQVLGNPAKKTREYTPNAHMTQCQYGGAKATANVEAGDCPFMKQFDAPADGKPVTGVGDYASAGASGLLTCKGNLALSVDVGITGTYTGAAATSIENQQLALEKKLANAVFAAN